jgi:hypothetical protein
MRSTGTGWISTLRPLNKRRQLSKRVVEERWTLTEAAAAAEERALCNSANPHIAALSLCDEVTLMEGSA